MAAIRVLLLRPLAFGYKPTAHHKHPAQAQFTKKEGLLKPGPGTIKKHQGYRLI
jgi:hypothetical protein